MTECLFCRIVDGDVPSTKVFEDDLIVAFEDITPAAPTHVLIIPKKHIATLNDADAGDESVLGRMMLTAQRIAAERNLSTAGYRTVMNTQSGAGQTVFHVHLHLLGGRGFTWPPG